MKIWGGQKMVIQTPNLTQQSCVNFSVRCGGAVLAKKVLQGVKMPSPEPFFHIQVLKGQRLGLLFQQSEENDLSIAVYTLEFFNPF